MPGRAYLREGGDGEGSVGRICRPLVLAGITGLGAGIFTAGLATLRQQPDVPFSVTVIAALGILWGTVTVAWPTGKR